MRDDFDRLWPLLEKAVLRYGPTHTKEDVWALVEDGRAQFWPGNRAAMVTTFEVYPTGFKEIIGWLAAGNLDEIRLMEQFVSGWAMEQGCDRVRLTCRRGFRRAFNDKGYRETMVLLTKEL